MVTMALSFVAMACLRNWAMIWVDDFDNGIEFCGNDLSEELGSGMG